MSSRIVVETEITNDGRRNLLCIDWELQRGDVAGTVLKDLQEIADEWREQHELPVIIPSVEVAEALLLVRDRSKERARKNHLFDLVAVCSAVLLVVVVIAGMIFMRMQ